MPKPKLTRKQKAFVQEYLVDLNGTQAAIRAGYSPRTAQVQASKMLALPHVQEAVQAAIKAREKRTEITQDRVLAELARIAFADLKDYVAFGPKQEVTFKDPEHVDGRVIAEIGETITQYGGSKRLKLHDKLRALELLGKHLGMFVDRVEHTGAGGGPINLQGVPGGGEVNVQDLLRDPGLAGLVCDLFDRLQNAGKADSGWAGEVRQPR